MKQSLLKKYFFISPNEKITEKVFLTQMTLSIVSIIICVISVAYCAVAFFSHENIKMTMQIDRFDLVITPPDVCEKIATNTFRLNNESDAPATYEFLLEKNSPDVALGFCRVSVADFSGKIGDFYTHPIGAFLKDGQTVTQDSRSVCITVDAQKSVSVNFTAQNGSCALDTFDGNIDIK